MKDELQLKAHRLDSFATTSLQCEDKFGQDCKARLKAVAMEVRGPMPWRSADREEKR